MRFACFLALFSLSCAPPPPRSCADARDCGAKSVCVASRCEGLTGDPQIQSGDRIVVTPRDIAVLTDREEPALPALVVLGDARDSRLFLQFRIPAHHAVTEAFLVLHRSNARAAAAPIVLHASEIKSEWDSRSITRAFAPAIGPVRSRASMGVADEVVRLDFTGFLDRLPHDQPSVVGVVVESEGTASAGMPIATMSTGPTIELYQKK